MRRLVLAATGMLVLQLAWILAIPAFGGIDEFDHAYRAASVARGEWAPRPVDATRGTGAWVHVPASFVDAARPECQLLKYTTDADCVGTRTGDTVRIATGAGRYHPLFYAIIGYPSLPFHGEAALYAMRAANAVLCSALFLLGLLAMRRWARSAWAYAGAIAACTPVVLYSTAIASPNGSEMLAAFAFWSSLIGLVTAAPAAIARRVDGSLLAIATTSGVLLATIRSLGPLFCVLIAVTVLITCPAPVARVRELIRTRSVQVASTILVLAAIGSVVWIETMKALVVGTEPTRAVTLGDKLSTTAGFLPLWLFQSIAAFPFRDQPSPALVYVLVLAIGVTVVVQALRTGGHRNRIAMITAVLLSGGVPFVISLGTIDQHAGAWQGRYGLPYSLGLLLLAGQALDSRPRGPHRLLIAGAATFTAIATYVALSRVLDIERGVSPSYASGAWNAPSAILVLSLALVGAGLMWSVAADLGADSAEDRQNPLPAAAHH
ncbi:DUF2142 domain-containing protein [Nocardioides marmorisolisilvae]|nr:DUF2142 domain-containing protein [Nocardioides marmorisolisilvae]